MSESPTVCVIGAGASGLSCMKECEELGLTPVCLEQHCDIGGLWNFSEKPRRNQGTGAYCTLITNSSKEMMCFTDYPFPPDTPPYLPYYTYQNYLANFAQHFDLVRYIRFETMVKSIIPSHDHDVTGNWVVCSFDKEGNKKEETFAFVVVCTGFCQKLKMPEVPGMEKFKKKIIHMHDYRRPEIFTDKRVLIVGNANSAGDIASDASHVAKQTYVSIGGGTWILTRLGAGGTPRDFMMRRFILRNLPAVAINAVMKKDCNARINHVNFGLAHKKGPMEGAPVMVNDEISYQLITGKIKAVGLVTEYTETGVILDDGQKIDNLDVVVYATGYKPSFPFLSKDIVPARLEDFELYKMVFPARRHHHSLAFIGCFSTVGAHAPAIELQSRLIARVFAKKHQLPTEQFMLEDIKRTKDEIIALYGQMKFKVNALKFRDEIADELGVRPDFWTIFKRSPKVAFQCLFGPAFPVQYRLIGPGSRDWAWQANDLAWKNTIDATKNRRVEVTPKSSAMDTFIFKLFIFILLIAIILMAV